MTRFPGDVRFYLALVPIAPVGFGVWELVKCAAPPIVPPHVEAVGLETDALVDEIRTVTEQLKVTNSKLLELNETVLETTRNIQEGSGKH